MQPQRSELDSHRFGRRIFRVHVENAAEARDAVEAARRERAEMLIARCPVTALDATHALERAGFLLMDTLVYYTGKAARFVEAPVVPGVTLRPFAPADLGALEAVARIGFTSYAGHYHADPRLDAATATEGYVDWLRRSTDAAAVSVIVAELDGRPVGFLTLRHGEPADIELNAVAPEARGRGIYDGLVKAAGRLARERGSTSITVSTQINNFTPQRVWTRNGLQPDRAFYTFHGWLDA